MFVTASRFQVGRDTFTPAVADWYISYRCRMQRAQLRINMQLREVIKDKIVLREGP